VRRHERRIGGLDLLEQANGRVRLARRSQFSVADGSSSTQTVTAGQTAVYNLQLAAANGFTGAVTLTCAGAPADSTCTAMPGSLSVTGASSSFTVNVPTTEGSGRGGVALPRRRRLAFVGSAALLLLASLTFGGCSVRTRIVQGTPTGNYPLTISGTINGVTRTEPFTLIVN